MNNQEIIAEKISFLIERSSYTKSEIARLMGVTRGSVQGWTRKGSISRQNLIKLCAMLDVSLDSILVDNENSYVVDNSEISILKEYIKRQIDLYPNTKIEILKAIKTMLDS
ncbi:MULTISPECIES: helix-turn-helix transcriptional regulator [Photobacterium]|jgi:transcriptional regulator with XRE-family HTH domain|uniref:XRE family transcriptional regulator n=1 Tax=Photobacterium iliopiscarium TaxID=56192 RepID=A0ABX5GM25_9GAMM|nr:helix-turn-helix transcriptional regulator [Photobacterium iliopiscarium]KJG19441.1 hypothetical protein UB37_18300 [Photobacterium iliopiscarium]PSW90473.1 XRE family transcriptional regulator [Photobacterium iliopiscarium]